jgi:hypothetical protein
MEAYNIQKSFDEFSAAQEQFNMIVDTLRSREIPLTPRECCDSVSWPDALGVLSRWRRLSR